jgi:hypothetical protein
VQWYGGPGRRRGDQTGDDGGSGEQASGEAAAHGLLQRDGGLRAAQRPKRVPVTPSHRKPRHVAYDVRRRQDRQTHPRVMAPLSVALQNRKPMAS